MVSVIIPALDEAGTIHAIVASAVTHPWVREVIVVDDGSTDATRDVAEKAGATVISLRENLGKGHALDVGVKRAQSDTLLFLDADVLGGTHEIISFMIRKVRDEKYDLFVGIRGRKLFWMNKLLRITPILGGERILRRELWEAVPRIYKNRFEIEIATNYYAKRGGRRMGFAIILGMHHVIKEKKHGLWKGLKERARMIGNILDVSLRIYVGETVRRMVDRS